MNATARIDPIEIIAKETATFDKYMVFPRFATYWPKLALFAIVFGIIMVVIVRVSVAPAPLTPNFRMLYDIFFGSHAEAERKLDTYILTAISLSQTQTDNKGDKRKGGKQNTNKNGKESFEPDSSINEDTVKLNSWNVAAQKCADVGVNIVNYIYATLFITGHTVSVNAT